MVCVCMQPTTWFVFVGDKMHRFPRDISQLTLTRHASGLPRSPGRCMKEKKSSLARVLSCLEALDTRMYTITQKPHHACMLLYYERRRRWRAIKGSRALNAMNKRGSHVPAQAPYDFFLGFPEMLQRGHLLSWHHEILHASPLLSSSGSSVLLAMLFS